MARVQGKPLSTFKRTLLPPRRPVGLPRGAARGRKGKSGNQTAIEAPNTLQSHVLVGIIDLLGEGPIGGFVNGGQSIYFNNYPLLNTSNGYNFKGVTWQLRTGTPDQTPVTGFPSADNTVQLGTLVSHLAPVDFEITNTDCNRAAVTIEIPALFLEDTKNGNINAYYIKVVMTVTPEGGTAQTVVNDQINGKCTSPYQRTFTFDLPGAGPWTIAISRPNADSTTATITDQWYVSAVDEIVDWQMIYPNCAYVAITFDSEYFGSTIPTRTYDIEALIVQIPANYDPVALTYATTGTGTSGGTWDGATFSSAVTSNPAWIVYDLISNNRYGMGLNSAALSLTKWDCYLIGQYCDESVPDGFGGTEPRFTCNVSITSRDDAYRVLQSLIAIFRGMAYWNSGTMRLTADMPTAISKIVNQADVIDGNFTYEGTSLKTRHTMAIVSYLEPKDYWQPTPIVYQNPDLTVLNIVGPQLLQVNAIGATTAGQAFRQAKWLITAETLCTDTVTYQCGLDHLGVVPGDVVAIADPAYAGLRMGGRILAVSVSGGNSALHLDSAIVPADGVTYAITVALIDGTLAQDVSIEAWVQNDDGTTTVEIASQEAAVEAGALWIVTSSTVAPRQYRVIGVTEPQPGMMEVTALYHDPNLYEDVDYNIDLSDNPFSVLQPLQTEPITPPTNVQASSYFQGEGTTTVLTTTVGWTPPDDLRVTSYDIQAYSDQGYQNSWSDEPGPTYDIPNLPVANYVFGVRSRTQTGATSDWAFSSETLINGAPPTPPTVTGLTGVGGARQISLYWTDVGIYNLLYYIIQRAPVTDGTIGTFSTLTNVDADSYVDSNSSVLTPLSSWAYRVAAVDTLLNQGAFCSPIIVETNQLLTDDLADAIIGTAQIAQGLELVGIGTTLPANLAANGGNSLFFSTTTGQMYTWNGTAFTNDIPAVNVVGLLSEATLAASQITGELTSSQIATLETSQLTGEIQAGQLAAASVLAENLAVGAPSNVIWNPCCGLDASGWVYGGASGGSVFAAATATGDAPTASEPWTNYALPSLGSGAVLAPSVAAAGQYWAQWSPTGSGGIPVTPGDVYAAAAFVEVSQGEVYAQIGWYDDTGTYISSSLGTAIAAGTLPLAGNVLGYYTQASLIATAPANAATAIFLIVGKNSTSGTITNPWFIFTQAQFGPVPPNSTTVPTWQPGGVTTIGGGVIQTGSINADRIVSQSITAAQIAANTITAGQIAATTITADQLAANTITAGKIAAGAIGAAQIAAGAIEATNLAADFALFQWEQVGYLVVNNLNVVGGSISSFYSASCGLTATSPAITLTITTGANADGSDVTRSGMALCVATVSVEETEGTGTWPPEEIFLNQDGTQVGAGYTYGQALGQIVFMVPVSLTTGSSTFTLTGNSTEAKVTASLIVFVTSV